MCGASGKFTRKVGVEEEGAGGGHAEKVNQTHKFTNTWHASKSADP